MQCACAILQYVACPALKARFSKKILFNIKCVFRFSLQLLSETFLILRRNERDMIKNVYGSSRKVRIILVRF